MRSKLHRTQISIRLDNMLIDYIDALKELGVIRSRDELIEKAVRDYMNTQLPLTEIRSRGEAIETTLKEYKKIREDAPSMK